MRSVEYIALKQQAWARMEGIPLKRSPDPREPSRHTLTVEDNLYWKRLLDPVRASFAASPGGELGGDPPGLSALDSTAAMAINLLQYWMRKDYLQQLPRLLQFPKTGIVSAMFQDLCTVGTDEGKESGSLECSLVGPKNRIGIHCALAEPYQAAKEDFLDPAGLPRSRIWERFPACRKVAAMLSTRGSGYHRLRASHLLKCLHGLSTDSSIESVSLIYLYFDSPGEEAARHRQEIRKFEAATASDPFTFIAMPVQRFIARASRLAARERGYVDYLSKRYL